MKIINIGKNGRRVDDSEICEVTTPMTIAG